MAHPSLHDLTTHDLHRIQAQTRFGPDDRDAVATALLEAVEHYDPTRGASLATFVYACARNNYLDGARYQNRHAVKVELDDALERVPDPTPMIDPVAVALGPDQTAYWLEAALTEFQRTAANEHVARGERACARRAELVTQHLMELIERDSPVLQADQRARYRHLAAYLAERGDPNLSNASIDKTMQLIRQTVRQKHGRIPSRKEQR